MQTIEIRSNIAGRLRKIREGVVYQNITSVIGELAQNSQRAKANTVTIELHDDYLMFADDGVGCDDPQVVFELDYSGFGIGFGEGFSSVFSIADELTVLSKTWSVTLDVVKIMETGNFNIEVKPIAPVDGFTVSMKGEKIRQHRNELQTFIRETAALLPMKVIFNGEEVEKIDLMKQLPRRKRVDFTYPVDNELFSGVMTPGLWEDFRLYYENRVVCDHWVQGAYGNIILKPNAVTLKAPDRRDLVHDEKYRRFMEKVKEEIANMYREFIQVATEEELEEFSDVICQYLDVQDYVDVLTFDGEMDYDIVKKKEEQDEEEEVSLDFFHEEVNEQLDFSAVSEGRVETDTTRVSSPQANGALRSMIRKMVKKPRVVDIKKTPKMVWIRAADIPAHREELDELEYYGFKILIAKNVLYEKAFQFLNIPCIKSLSKDTVKESTVKNVELKTKKEARFMALLKKIEKHYDIEGTFRIADLSMEIRHMVDGRVVEREKYKVEGLCKGAHIYLDRKSLEFPKYKVSKWDSPTITVDDLKFLMRNLDTIAHELAHLLGGIDCADNTPQHRELQAKISREIADLF